MKWIYFLEEKGTYLEFLNSGNPERMCIYVKKGEHDLCLGSPVSELFSTLHNLYPSLIMLNSNGNLNSPHFLCMETTNYKSDIYNF